MLRLTDQVARQQLPSHLELDFTPEILGVLRQAQVEWQEVGSGAPRLVLESVHTLGAKAGPALQVFAAFAVLSPGDYDWQGKPFHFTVVHAALIKAFNIRTDEGHAYVDPKRPYGDMSNYYLDMANVIGVKHGTIDGEGHADFTPLQRQSMDLLHHETEPALAVFLRYAHLELGRFSQAPAAYGPWRRTSKKGTRP